MKHQQHESLRVWPWVVDVWLGFPFAVAIGWMLSRLVTTRIFCSILGSGIPTNYKLGGGFKYQPVNQMGFKYRPDGFSTTDKTNLHLSDGRRHPGARGDNPRYDVFVLDGSQMSSEKKNWLVRLYRGWKTSQVYRDYNLRIPVNQPVWWKVITHRIHVWYIYLLVYHKNQLFMYS